MTNHHSLRTVFALLTTTALMVGAGAVQAATDKQTVEVRKQEEQLLKEQDSEYSQQAKAKAEQYRTTASLVASQGGDPAPLLKAADYFDAQAQAAEAK